VNNRVFSVGLDITLTERQIRDEVSIQQELVVQMDSLSEGRKQATKALETLHQSSVVLLSEYHNVKLLRNSFIKELDVCKAKLKDSKERQKTLQQVLESHRQRLLAELKQLEQPEVTTSNVLQFPQKANVHPIEDAD
jgi:hypothetical protein